MKHKLALFDLDGTLYNGQVWQALVAFLWQRRLNRGAVAGYVARNMTRYLLYKAKLMRRDYVWDRFARELMGMLRTIPADDIPALADALYQHHIAPRLDPDLLAEWEAFGAQGYTRIILSGSPTMLIAAIGRALNAAASLGTEAEVRANRLTGRITGDLVHGKAKMNHLLQFVAAQGWSVNWRDSHAFGDSHTDLPVLSLVGHPHAVRPDARLHAHAQTNGWPIRGIA